MRKSAFTRYLSSLSKEELVEELDGLFENIQGVREYYAMELGSEADRQKIYDQARKNIERYYASKSKRKPKAPRVRLIQSLLRDFHRLSVFDHEMTALYLFDVDKGLAFLETHYFYSTTLINHLGKSYEAACAMIREGRLQTMFLTPCERLLRLSAEYPEIYSQFHTSFLATFRK